MIRPSILRRAGLGLVIGLPVWAILWKPGELAHFDTHQYANTYNRLMTVFGYNDLDTLYFHPLSNIPGRRGNYFKAFQLDTAYSSFFPVYPWKEKTTRQDCIVPITTFSTFPKGQIMILRGPSEAGCLGAVYAYFYMDDTFIGTPFTLADSVRKGDRITYRSSYLWDVSYLNPQCLHIIREGRLVNNQFQQEKERFLLLDFTFCRPDTISTDSDYLFARWGYLTRTSRMF